MGLAPGKGTFAVVATISAVAAVLLWPKSGFGIATLAVRWENAFTLEGRPLSGAETKLVKLWAVHTLRRAYSGFAVELSDQSGTNVIRVRDACTHTSWAMDRAGETWPLSKSSSVCYGVLAKSALVHAPRPRDRRHVLMGLGQAIGATAAHEFAHQWPIGMSSLDQRDDKHGYDYYTYDRLEHFHGRLRWTEASLRLLQRNLRY